MKTHKHDIVLLRAIVPRAAERELPALESLLQALALDRKRPIALEMVSVGTQQQFCVRGSDPETLAHLRDQIQARYPQATFREVTDQHDPLRVRPGERVRVVELTAGAGSHLPLRSWTEREMEQTGVDPLLGVLAAMRHLPPGMRVVSQLALLPASPTWSKRMQRLSLEHPLEHERQRQRAGSQSAGPPVVPLLGALLLLAVVLLSKATHLSLAQLPARFLPQWVLQAAVTLQSRHQLPPLTFAHEVQVVLAALVLVLLGSVPIVLKKLLFHRPLYDPRMVQQKISGMAYHTRLRLYVIGPANSIWLRERWQRRLLLWLPRQLWRSVCWFAGTLWKGLRAPRRSVQSLMAFVARGTLPLVEGGGWIRWRLLILGIKCQRWWWRYRGVSGHLRAWLLCCQHAVRWIRALRPGHLTRAGRWLAKHTLQMMRWLWRHSQRGWQGMQTRTRRAWAVVAQWAGDAWERRQRKQESTKQMREAMTRTVAAYRQYDLATGGYFVARRLPAWFIGSPLVSWKRGVGRSPQLLGASSLSTLWRFPRGEDLVDVPGLEHTRARTYPVPRVLTVAGSGRRIGTNTHAGETLPVYLPYASLRRNNFTQIASTGMGKSTLFVHTTLAAFDSMQDGMPADQRIDGVIVIDPHGEMVQQILQRVPDDLAASITVVDFADRAHPPGLNPLDMSGGRDRDKAVDHLVSVLRQVYKESWGQRTETILEYAAKSLADVNARLVEEDDQQGAMQQYTLLDIIPLLRRTSFRHSVLEQVRDQALLDWWEQYYELLDLHFQDEIISSLVNKLSKYSSSHISRNILGQPVSTINFKEILRDGKSLLISLSSGLVGSDLASVLGATLLGLFQAALTEQAEIPEAQRKVFLVLIDEFQTLPGVSYNSMLAELRKRGGRFGLGTQSLAYLDKLDPTLRATLLSNVQQHFAFKMSADDAFSMGRELMVERDEILHLDDYSCYARISLDGQRLPTFSLNLDPLPPGQAATEEALRQKSRDAVATPRHEVEEMLRQANTRQRTAIANKPVFPTPTTPKSGEEESQPPPGPRGKAGARRRGGQSSKDLSEDPASQAAFFEEASVSKVEGEEDGLDTH